MNALLVIIEWEFIKTHIKPPVYKELVRSISLDIAGQLRQIGEIAGTMNALMTRASREYVDSWRLCAMMVPDHPELPQREKYCQDYRADGRAIDHSKYYSVGTEVMSNYNIGKFSMSGKVIELLDGGMMKIKLRHMDKRRKDIIVTIDRNSLHVFPYKAKISISDFFEANDEQARIK